MMSNDLLTCAFEYWDRGWPAIPTDGKTPLTGVSWSAYQEKRPTVEQLKRWFAESAHNIAIVLRMTGLVVIDCDTPADAAWWRENHPVTPLAVTSGGRQGTHFWYRRVGTVGCRTGILGRKIDVKGEGGLAVVPPSVTKQAYQWEPWGYYCWDEIPTLDSAWLGPPRAERIASVGPLTDSPTIRRGRAYIAKITAVSGQGGHNATFRAACKLRDSGAAPDEALQLLIEWNQSGKAVPPWSEKELRHKIGDAFKLGSSS